MGPAAAASPASAPPPAGGPPGDVEEPRLLGDRFHERESPGREGQAERQAGITAAAPEVEEGPSPGRAGGGPEGQGAPGGGGGALGRDRPDARRGRTDPGGRALFRHRVPRRVRPPPPTWRRFSHRRPFSLPPPIR